MNRLEYLLEEKKRIEEEIEKLENQPKFPEEGEKYWFVGANGGVWSSTFYLSKSVHYFLFKLGNYYETEEEARKEEEKEKWGKFFADASKIDVFGTVKKPKFNIEDYEGKYVMELDDETETKIFRIFLDEQGRKWSTGIRYIEFMPVSPKYYYFNEGQYSFTDEFQKEYTTLKFSDFDWSDYE